MADQEPEETANLPYFPDPPPFYKHFTAANRLRLADLDQEAGTSNDDTATTPPPHHPAPHLTPAQILALPTELRYLIPPSPPADDEEFKVFGLATKASGTDKFEQNMEYIAKQLDALQVLPGWRYEQLYESSTATSDALTAATADSDPPSSSAAPKAPPPSRQTTLFRLLRSILTSYLSLLGILAVAPTSPAKNEKLADILTLVANMHALVNEYRPHQARETLIGMMERQVERKREEIEGVRRIKGRVGEVLGGLGRIDQGGEKGGEDDEMVGAGKVGRREAQAELWEALDELVG